MKHKLLFGTLMMCGLASCDRYTEYTKTSFVDAFYSLSGISLEAGNCNDGNPYVLVYPKDIQRTEPPYFDYMIFDYTAIPGESDKEYKRLVDSYGDNAYPETKVAGPDGYPVQYAFPDKRISGVDVIAKSDYDSDHKAGSKLNDIVNLASVSPYKYIKSGYNDNASDPFTSVGSWFYELFDSQTEFPPYYPVFVPLSNVGKEDFLLLGKGKGSFIQRALPEHYYDPRNPEHEIGYLIFNKKPDLEAEVDIVITFADGSSLKNAVQIK